MATIVIYLDEELKGLEAPMRAMAKLVDRCASASRGNGRTVDYASVEDRFADCAAAIERAAHELMLQALDVNEPHLLIGGKPHTQVLRTRGTFKSLAGSVAVEHSRYRPVGERNAPTVDAISLRTGAVGDGWLPRTAGAIAHGLQMTTSRDAHAQAREQHRLPYSRSSFERVAHLVGEDLVQNRLEIEDELIECLEIPDVAASASVSIDRVSLPMEEARPRPVGRSRKNAPKRAIERVYRMAYCATLTLHDDKGKALQTIRYGRMPSSDGRSLAYSLGMDLKALLTKRPDLKIVALADGAQEMWTLLDSDVCKESLGVEVLRLIDYWHVVEKLAAANRVMKGGTAKRLSRWKFLLLNRVTAVDKILATLKRSGRVWHRVGDGHPVREAITYLENNWELMRYTTARRRGLPIASGQVEATCKTLVQVRMKRAGARWKTDTGDHILQLRALALSDRWSDGMALVFKKRRRHVRAA